MGLIRSGRQAKSKELIEINDLSKGPALYHLVIIDTPVWAWTMSSPIRSLIHKYKNRLNNIAIFCTCGSVGADSTLSEMEELCGKKAFAWLGLKTSELNEGVCELKIKGFIEDIKNK